MQTVDPAPTTNLSVRPPERPTTDGAAAPPAPPMPVAAAASRPGAFRRFCRRSLSIRARLTLWNVAILTGALLVFSASLYAFLAWSLDREISESLPQQYTQIRDSADLRVGRGPDGGPQLFTDLRPDTFGSDELDLYVQISSLSGTVPERGRSSNLGNRFLPIAPEVLDAAREGHTYAQREIVVDGYRMRLFSGPLLLRTPGGERTPVGVIQVARSLERTEQTLGLIRLLVIGVGLGSLLLAGVVGFALSGAALAPLDRLSQTVRDIGATRDFSRRVEHTGPDDEVGQLTRTFNEMLAQLQAAHNSLAQALETQRRFVADASHELRTPLTTIRGNVGLLRRVANVDPADRAAALADIESEAERMARLVGQMLSLARADAGLTLSQQAVDLDGLVWEAGRQLTLLADAAGLTATVGPVEPARVLGNADGLKQLLLILIDNAVTYTPPPGTVRLSLTATAGSAVVEVADTGIGIAADQIPRIFERFYRADSARSGQGAGIGLAIARWLVDIHHGRIEVDSTPGEGSNFRVVLPLMRET